MSIIEIKNIKEVKDAKDLYTSLHNTFLAYKDNLIDAQNIVTYLLKNPAAKEKSVNTDLLFLQAKLRTIIKSVESSGKPQKIKVPPKGNKTA